MRDITEFTNYMNSFYGIGGIYSSGRNLTVAEVANGVIKMLENKEANFEGDSVDRERVRDIIFSQEEQQKMYKN